MRKPITTRKTATSSSSSSPSSTTTRSSPEISLDPQGEGEWEALRQLGQPHGGRDARVPAYGAGAAGVWRPVPADVRKRLSAGPAPRRPANPRTSTRNSKRDVLPYPTGNIHPRFLGLVIGNRDAVRDAGRYARLRHESAGCRVRRRARGRRGIR